MPEQAKGGRRTWPGFLILASLVLAALLIFNLTALGDLVGSRYDVVVVLNEAEGIRVGSAVRVAGVESGRVTGVGILPHGDSVLVAVTVRLVGSTRDVVRTDSEGRAVRLRVIGEPLIDVAPGSPDRPPVQSGDTLWSQPRLSVRRLLDRAGTLPRQFDSLLVSMDRVTALANARSPRLEELQRRVEFVVVEGSRLGERLAAGSLGPLLGDPAFAERLAALGAGVGELATALQTTLDRYAPVDEDAELAVALGSLRDRTVALQAGIDTLRLRLEGGRGFIPRHAADRAIEREIEGIRAQIDSLRAEAAGLALRMILPW